MEVATNRQSLAFKYTELQNVLLVFILLSLIFINIIVYAVVTTSVYMLPQFRGALPASRPWPDF